MRFILLEDSKTEGNIILTNNPDIEAFENMRAKNREQLFENELKKLNDGKLPRDSGNIIEYLLGLLSHDVQLLNYDYSPFVKFLVNHYTTNNKSDFPKDSQLLKLIYGLQVNGQLNVNDLEWLQDYQTLLTENDERNAFKVKLIAFTKREDMKEEYGKDIEELANDLQENGHWKDYKGMKEAKDKFIKDEDISFSFEDGKNSGELNNLYLKAYNKNINAEQVLPFIKQLIEADKDYAQKEGNKDKLKKIDNNFVNIALISSGWFDKKFNYDTSKTDLPEAIYFTRLLEKELDDYVEDTSDYGNGKDSLPVKEGTPGEVLSRYLRNNKRSYNMKGIEDFIKSNFNSDLIEYYDFAINKSSLNDAEKTRFKDNWQDIEEKVKDFNLSLSTPIMNEIMTYLNNPYTSTKKPSIGHIKFNIIDKMINGVINMKSKQNNNDTTKITQNQTEIINLLKQLQTNIKKITTGASTKDKTVAQDSQAISEASESLKKYGMSQKAINDAINKLSTDNMTAEDIFTAVITNMGK